MKGQWFIISAVIASSIFLGISFLLKDYFIVNSAVTARSNNDFYLNSIEEQLNNIVRNTVTNRTNCINLTANLDEFRTMAERNLASKGVFAKIEYAIVQCAPNIVRFNFIVASEDQVVYNFTTRRNVSEFIG